MPKLSIGRARSGREIFVDSDAWKNKDFRRDFIEFSDHEAFDALLAVEFLAVRERRRQFMDWPWVDSLEAVGFCLGTDFLGNTKVAVIKLKLNIHTAFDARAYGEAIVHSYLRSWW